MPTNRVQDLPQDYALVLQQVQDSGEEDFVGLSETLQMDRSRLTHIIQALQHKGLIKITRNAYADAWIRLSTKGQRVMATMWPESMPAAA